MTKKNLLTSLIVLVILYLTIVNQPNAQTATPQLGKSSVKTIVAAMTLEEKVRLLVGMGFRLEGMPLPKKEDANTAEKVPGAAGRTHAIARFGIPSLTLSDGPAGVRISPIRNGDQSKTYYATGFPIATLVASTWDPEIARQIGAGQGSEARDYGIDILLAPAMNIQRNPLGGRNFEYFSEDPLIAGKMAAAFVKGVQDKGVGASIKHFAANNQEFNRAQSNSIVGERALREIYLRSFEVAVKESQPWTVMSSYNLINGTYASQSRDLLTTLLRDEWGFKGLVMSDWFGGADAVAQLQAGNDLLMPGTDKQSKAIVEAVNSGRLSNEQLNKNVERVLNIVLLTPTFKNYRYSDRPDLKGNAEIVRATATEGMVLLKNDDQVLPLDSPTKVALLGNSSYNLIAGGTGSGDVNKKYVVSLAQGLEGAGYSLDESLKQDYTQFIADQIAKRPQPAPFRLPKPIPEMPIQKDRLEQLAADSNVAVFTLGRNSGEFEDRKVENDFTLTPTEQSLIENVAHAFHAQGKKVVVLLNIGGPVETASWRSMVDAILLAWQPGQEGGNSIVDVLSGKINPSGKLAITFPMSYSDVPSAGTFPGKELAGAEPEPGPLSGKPTEAVYEEGIYVGYRYYDSFNVKPAYAFGYGLSYTTFSYGKATLSANKFQNKVSVSIAVTNTGKVPGKEVVQLYVAAPMKKLLKPTKELRNFAKTRLLKPGETQTLSFTLTGRDLASFDPETSSWIAEAGNYSIEIGSSSADIKSSATMELARELIVEKAEKLLAPDVAIRELQPRR